MSDFDDTDDTISDESEQYDGGKLRTCSGLLKSYHGVAYQIQWLMVVAIEAKKRGKVDGFRFRTEVDYEDSGKFDDVVWEYYSVQENKIKYNFLQAKHKLNEEHDRITMKDLKAAKNPFGLRKYYISYIESIQNNHKYVKGSVENLIIATNIDLDDNLKQIFKYSKIQLPLLNAFESGESKLPNCWKIDPNVQNIASIVVILEETHDLIKLAKLLEDLIFNDKEFIIPKELQEYSCSIFKNLLNVDYTKISNDFIENKNLSNETTFLREAFHYVAFVEKRHLNNDDMIHSCKETKDNIEDFANFFASKINDAQYKNKLVKIRLSKISKSYENYKRNVKRLANFVLIKRNGIKFNPKFWIENKTKRSSYFKTLKMKLICKLIEYGVISIDDSNKEISAKLDPYRFQVTNFTTCMMHLTDEISFWEVVKDYNTRLSTISNQCGVIPKGLPNYNLRKVREDINNFLSILVFAVNFTKSTLNEAVEDYFNESFKWIDNEFTAYAFRSEIASTLDLTQEKFISNAEEVNHFFNKVEKETNRLILIGPTLEYCTKIELYDIEFQSDAINVPSLICFINYDEHKLKGEHSKKNHEYDNFYSKQVLCVMSNQILLSSIKVYHLLKKSVKYASQKNYIFMRLESIIYLYEHVMNVFEKSINLLIIECDFNSKFDLRKISKKIISILRSDNTKKVMLITQGYHYLINTLKNEFKSSYCEIVDPEIHFSNLQEKTQQKLLQNYKISFQGKEHSLGELIKDFENFIDSQILCHCLNNNVIELCNKFLTNDDILNFYISREIICQKKVSTDFLKDKSTDLYALSNIKINDFMNIVTQFHRSETNIASKVSKFDNIDLNDLSIVKFAIVDDHVQYNFLWEANDKSKNVHWLIKENNYFKWNATKGSKSILRPYMRPRKYYSEADNEIIHELKNDRIVIIAADPGMGKSTLIKHLALKLKDEFPSLWVLVIDLGKFRSELKKIKLNDKKSVINFLITVADFKIIKQIEYEKSCSKIIDWFSKQLDTKDFIKQMKVGGIDLLEIIIFYIKLHKSGEIYIFLDGFDEICPIYEAQVTYLIKILKSNSMAHIWTTCRTYNIINTLEDNLEIVSYGIKSFSEKDQELFLLKYWKSKLNFDILDEERAKIFIVTLLFEFSKATNDTKRTFVGIPLQIQMLAQNRLIMFKEFYESGVVTLNNEDKLKIIKGLNLVNLYDDFIDIKFHEIRFKEKKHTWPSDDEDIEQMIKESRKQFIYEHKVLSIYALYAGIKELCSENIKSKALSLLPKIRMADDKNAIICGVIDESPVFVHQTYAEYFASLFLWNKFQSVTLEEFSGKFLLNMLNGIFFSDERLQVCKFFYFMADKYFNDNIQCIYKGKEDIKIVSILQRLSEIIYVIYDSYENQGIFSKGIDDITIKDFTTTEKHIERVFKQNPQFAQVVKLLFYIIESYLSANKSDHVIYTILKKCNTIHFLQMASEIGCLNFVKTFLSVKDDYNFKKWLKCSKWYFSPVWLAARNGHLDVLKQLSLVIDQEWPDKDDRTLTQRAYNLPECDVLQNCLLLNIIDANPYPDLNNIQTLPIVNALQNVWPLNLIKILIEKTDINIFNKFVCNNSQLIAPIAVCTSLLKYETSVVSLMIKKGVNFFGALNVLLFEFTVTSLYGPINSVKYATFYGPSFHSEQEYLRVYELIETFLHLGVAYNSFDDTYSVITSEYCKQIYYMHQLFMYFADYKVSNIDGVYLLLKLILNAVTDKCEIIKRSNRSLLLRVKMLNCSTPKKKKTYTTPECCNKTWPKSMYDGIIIQLVPTSQNDIFHSLDKTKDAIENSLTNVTKYIEKAAEEIEEFRKYPDCKVYNSIFIAYEEMLKYRFKCDVSKKTLFQSLSHFERYIFQWVLNLYIRQDYNIYGAFNEVCHNLWRYKMIREWLQEKPHDCNISYEEIMKIFGLDLGNGTNESRNMQFQIMEIIINILNCGALKLLLNIWNDLNYVGENIFQKVIRSMSKYEHLSKKIFDLFNRLDAYYVWIIDAIKSGKSQNLLKVLKDIDNTFVKSVINAQNYDCGSPLHYAVFVGNVEMVRILLTHSADRNQELQFNCKLLGDSEQYTGNTPRDIAQEREHLNPEVYATIIEVLSDLSIGSNNNSS